MQFLLWSAVWVKLNYLKQIYTKSRSFPMKEEGPEWRRLLSAESNKYMNKYTAPREALDQVTAVWLEAWT